MLRYLLPTLLLILSCSDGDTQMRIALDEERARKIQYKIAHPEDLQNGPYPLILLSHGSGGAPSNQAWLTKALVKQGYLVAAPLHPANNIRHNSDTGVISVWERPADLSKVLDSLLADPVWSKAIDSDRVGAVGFSSGGYSVLALGGALYDMELFRTYCFGTDTKPDCRLAKNASSVDFSKSSLSYKDERIKAIFAMAPAIGPAISEDSLSHISVPVSITATKDDELILPEYHALRYANYIRGATLDMLEEGGHFIFMECNVITYIADWFIQDMDFCGRDSKVNKKDIRHKVAESSIAFFDKHLQTRAL